MDADAGERTLVTLTHTLVTTDSVARASEPLPWETEEERKEQGGSLASKEEGHVRHPTLLPPGTDKGTLPWAAVRKETEGT